MKKLLTYTHLIFTVFIFLSLNVVQADDISVKNMLQDNSSTESATKKQNVPLIAVPYDEFQRGTPRRALEGYLSAVKVQDYAKASEFIDYRNLRDSTLAIGKEVLAEQLYMVLNRSLWIDLDIIDDTPEGNLHDNLPSYRELIGVVMLNEKAVNITLQRVPRKKDRVKIWKISNATIAKLPKLAEAYGYTPFGEWLSERLPNMSMLNVMLWQWIYFLLVLIGSYFCAKVFTWLVATVVNKLKPSTSAALGTFIKSPVSLLLTIFIARIVANDANKTMAVEAITEGATLFIIAWTWVFLNFVDLMKVRLADYFVAQDKPLAVYLLRPAGNVAKSIGIIIAMLVWFENLGFSASTLLAGLGIGGLAIALAAQKTVENIIGAITLYSSAPVKIGNFCQFDGQTGVVEEIGLRATRVRTMDRTVVYIANAQFVDMKLENFSEREKIAFRPKLKLAASCKKDDVESFMAALKALLVDSPDVGSELMRVHFTGFDAWAIKIDVLAYIHTTDFDKYLDLSDALNLHILMLLEQHNCKLALPEARLV